jgi:hypothetical protein
VTSIAARAARLSKEAGSASPFAGLGISRSRINQAFMRDMLKFWERGGTQVIERVALEQPGTLLKCLTMLVPRELKVEHSNPTQALSDDQLAMMVAELDERISARLAGENAKTINAVANPDEPAKPKRKPDKGWEARRKAAWRAKRREAQKLLPPGFPE